MLPSLTINSSQPYPIYLDNFVQIHRLLPSHNVAVIIDQTVLTYYPELSQQFPAVFTIPPGEASKSRKQKAQLENQLFAAGFNRDCHLVAIGGGVTLDLTGFIAATFCRGVPVTYVPTSLLAMLDVCVGGKTGINTKYGKNTLGCISSPRQVLIDTQFLTTLASLEFRSGMVESLKHGLIYEADFFNWQVTQLADLLNLNHAKLSQLILKNLAIKAAIVQQDEFELGGIRQILNYGHTIGHAIEIASAYQLNHGAAIALGILAENYIAQAMGFLSEIDAQRIGEILSKLNILTSFNISNDVIFNALKYDKKTANQQINGILISKIGCVHQSSQGYSTKLASNLLKEAISWLQQSNRNGFCQFK